MVISMTRTQIGNINYYGIVDYAFETIQLSKDFQERVLVVKYKSLHIRIHIASTWSSDVKQHFNTNDKFVSPSSNLPVTEFLEFFSEKYFLSGVGIINYRAPRNQQ